MPATGDAADLSLRAEIGKRTRAPRCSLLILIGNRVLPVVRRLEVLVAGCFYAAIPSQRAGLKFPESRFCALVAGIALR
jgi:hypothetical protein